jgi:small-conductance mechanosensitive channel
MQEPAQEPQTSETQIGTAQSTAPPEPATQPPATPSQAPTTSVGGEREVAIREVEAPSSSPLTATVEQVSGETKEAVAQPATPSALSWIDFFKPEGIPYAFVILVIMIALSRLVSRQIASLAERFADRRLVIQQSGSFLLFFVYLLGILAVVFTLFDLTEQMLLAIGGTAAVAAGFAMKDLAASIVAGVIILVDRPFQAGDRVTFAGYYGEITHIGLRSVRLMTLDDTQVTIPNNLFLTQAVSSGNAGAVDMMIMVDLHIGLDQDLEEARRLLSEVVTTSRYVNLNRPWSVLVSEIIEQNYLAIRMRAKAYVLDARLEKAFEGDITERALKAFRSARIAPPAVLHRSLD